MYDDNSKATIKERINKHIIDTEPGEMHPMKILLDNLREATEKNLELIRYISNFLFGYTELDMPEANDTCALASLRSSLDRQEAAIMCLEYICKKLENGN